MAARRCPICHHMLGSTARRCPACGWEGSTTLIAVIVVLILAVLALGMTARVAGFL
jgi:RNA polymerase subunit RPABC4/transcription elongation factor Spt4